MKIIFIYNFEIHSAQNTRELLNKIWNKLDLRQTRGIVNEYFHVFSEINANEADSSYRWIFLFEIRNFIDKSRCQLKLLPLNSFMNDSWSIYEVNVVANKFPLIQ